MSRILLFYITIFSGHHRAALAVERALRQLAPGVEILMVDAFQYFNPVASQVVDRLYLSVIRGLPKIWDYLYDNPSVAQRSTGLRAWLSRYNAPKLEALLREFQPTVIACTQAFPCVIAGDYKLAHDLKIPLYAILTDFLPHRYWLHPAVDGYLTGSEAARAWFERAGVASNRIYDTGIPIDPVFAAPLDIASRSAGCLTGLGLNGQQPVVLVMGGGQGLGPIAQVAKGLDALPQPLQLVIVTGVNAKLHQRLQKAAPSFRRRVVVLGHVPFIPELMSVATVIVTKPGGLTTSEALAKRLPLIIVDPIPGQEAKNSRFLLDQQAAVAAPRWERVPRLVSELLEQPQRLTALAQAAGRLGRPRSALEIARLLLRHSA